MVSMYEPTSLQIVPVVALCVQVVTELLWVFVAFQAEKKSICDLTQWEVRELLPLYIRYEKSADSH